LKKGDLIKKINDQSLIGISNMNAHEMIENITESEIVTINYVRCPDFQEEGSYFKPTWRYFVSIPM
jgi:hypothetical protein